MYNLRATDKLPTTLKIALLITAAFAGATWAQAAAIDVRYYGTLDLRPAAVVLGRRLLREVKRNWVLVGQTSPRPSAVCWLIETGSP